MSNVDHDSLLTPYERRLLGPDQHRCALATEYTTVGNTNHSIYALRSDYTSVAIIYANVMRGHNVTSHWALRWTVIAPTTATDSSGVQEWTSITTIQLATTPRLVTVMSHSPI